MVQYKNNFQRRKNHRVQNNFLLDNPEYHLLYIQLLKEGRVWNSISQYLLGDEANRRAKCLLNGDVDGYKNVRYSDQLYL